jgi:hypothetical protein
VPAVTIEETQLALAAFAILDWLEKDGTGQATLLALCQRHAIVAPGVAFGRRA